MTTMIGQLKNGLLYMNKWVFRLILFVILSPITSVIIWYLVSFFPYKSKLEEISHRANQNIIDFSDRFYLLATTVETEHRIRAYAMRQAYWSLALKENRQSNISWHANNALWYISSYLHFDNQAIFGLWVDCSLYGCGKGLSEAARKYYGKNFANLSERELAGLVLLVRSPQRFIPGNEKAEKRINELLSKIENKREHFP